MLFVAGTGSFAVDVVEVARDAGHEVAGLIELLDAARVGTERHGLPVVGIDDPPAGATATIGAGGDRGEAAARLAAAGWARTVVLHPTAHVPASVTVAAGSFVGPGVIFGAAAAVDADAIVARGVIVGHHSTIGAGAVVNPGANIGGNAVVEAGAFLGMGCVVRDHVTIGRDALVAAGAVVVADVPAGDRVRGVPARSFA